MMHRLRRRSLALRALWVALLLLAVVFKPALVLASEAHDSGHALQTGHSHAADTHAIPADESVGDADAWHALMHMGHCCGQQTALPPLGFDVAHVAPAASPPRGLRAIAASIATTQPLRPPILG